eukprot:CAMPEP_0117561494 /NCGR_PEP_ID=MMETSP0784-20121206/54445_1 /TAXON_ID=39447 /ORGANISM="" /LENGTH=74 /DNA_ID=CAMNT_0005358985 /DNA_START=29 /DNA_END=253 /DNA_ORIENTATION=+
MPDDLGGAALEGLNLHSRNTPDARIIAMMPPTARTRTRSSGRCLSSASTGDAVVTWLQCEIKTVQFATAADTDD